MRDLSPIDHQRHPAILVVVRVRWSERTYRHASSADVNSYSEIKLLASVEGAQVPGKSRHCTTFEYTKEGSSNTKLLEVFDKGCAHRDKTKADDKEWQVKPWAYSLEDDIAGNLNHEVDDVEDGQCPVESVSNQVKIFRHTLNTRIANVRT